MTIHEEQFVRSFITPQKKERYFSMFASKKGRAKLIKEFYHLGDLDERYMTIVPTGEQWAENTYKTLKRKGAPEVCYVISTNPDLDGKELPLIEVLERIVGNCDDGTFISCIAGKLGYYEGESMGARYILEKQ